MNVDSGIVCIAADFTVSRGSTAKGGIGPSQNCDKTFSEGVFESLLETLENCNVIKTIHPANKFKCTDLNLQRFMMQRFDQHRWRICAEANVESCRR